MYFKNTVAEIWSAPNRMYFKNTVAEIWSAHLIFFYLLKNAVCIPCPVNNNFDVEISLLQ